MNNILVTKISGTQNTFLILDARSEDFNACLHQISGGLSRPQIAQKLCQSFLPSNSKTDGCIFIEKDTVVDFQWDFYNADGSQAQMCGNAARCVAWLAYKYKWVSTSVVRFRSASGIIQAHVDFHKNFVQVIMASPQILEQEKTFQYKDQQIKGLYVNTGVPHFVTQVGYQGFNKNKLKGIAKYLRDHIDFKPEGSNISFVYLSDKKVQGLTFERGVEDFTQSCGTGAVAMTAFLISRSVYSFNEDIVIELPGGKLIVKITDHYQQAFLSGDVEYLNQFLLTAHIFNSTLSK